MLLVLIVVSENDFLLFVKKVFIGSSSELKAVVQCVFDPFIFRFDFFTCFNNYFLCLGFCIVYVFFRGGVFNF